MLHFSHFHLLAALIFTVFFSCKNEKNASTTEAKPGAVPTVAEPKPATKTMLFFGTSLTAGMGLSEAEAFPSQIQKKIEAANLPYTVINAGLSGETSADGINRVEWVLSKPVDVFVLELGANDALRGQPVDACEKNLQGIIDIVKRKNPSSQVVLVGMKAPPNLGAAYTKAFEAMYPRLAKANQIPLVPFLLEGVAGLPQLNQADGIHPTAAGQAILAENVWKVLGTLLK